MIALTTQDIAAGWFIIGVVTCLTGVGVIALVRSSWSEKQARKPERTMTDWPSTARVVAAESIDLPRCAHPAKGFTPYVCDRPLNHAGSHAASSHFGATIARWLDDELPCVSGLDDHTATADRRLSSVARVVPMQRRGGE